jgi:hypothetical protein
MKKTGGMTNLYMVFTIYDGIVSSYKMAEIDVRLTSWKVKSFYSDSQNNVLIGNH